MYRSLFVLLAVSVLPLRAADPPRPNTLTPTEIADGCISLFDGETTFGWRVDGEIAIKDGELIVGGAQAARLTTTSVFGDVRFDFQYLFEAQNATFTVRVANMGVTPIGPRNRPSEWTDYGITVRNDGNKQVIETHPSGELRLRPSQSPVPTPLEFRVQEGTKLHLRNVKARPLALKPIFDGKDLSGWKVFAGDRYRSKFSVTPEGWLNVTNGPGDLQTEKQWADFVFQGECISNGKNLNSGIFFRCLPDQYQNGYEMQIHNGFRDGDRAKPVDFGTGAIYRRQPARKVVSSDGDWFAMTLAAHGNHMATWINGYQVVDWTDTRPPNPNPRNGSKVEAGHLSIQGHDPTTNLNFRNLRIAELPKK